MKNVKKLIGILMALTLVLSLGAAAFAASVIIDPQLVIEGHTFTAYQIFTGTQNPGSGNKLASVTWGSGIDADGFVAALKEIDEVKFADCKADDPQSVVKALSENQDLAGQIAEAAAASISGEGVSFTTSTKLPIGYYLIMDTTEDLNGNKAYNDVVLQVTEDVRINYKTDVPTSQKKVQDNDSDAWQDSADWDIGDVVPFQITGTLPDNYGDYDEYAITFHDKQSGGLTFDPLSVVVTVDGKELTAGEDYNVQFNVGDGCTFHVIINDLKTTAPDATADSTIVVTYSSKLNEDAVIGSAGNPNDMTMEFSNNAHGDGTGTTPNDHVIVFTYEFDANKVQPDGKDEEGNETFKPLEGAGFTLYKKDASGEALEGHEGTWKAVGEEKTGVTTFDFKGLDDGTYVLVETTVPAGFNKAEDLEFTIAATHDVDNADPKLLTFTATGDVTASETAESETGVTGKITTDVVNREGLELPETGGIGTTIFYVAGAVLVAGAVILLVTRKRMSAPEKEDK